MDIFLPNHLSGAWQPAGEPVNVLSDPVTGAALAACGGPAAGLDEGFAFARATGRAGLQALTYGQRAAMLAETLKVLQANREAYYEISLANSGTTRNDSAVDIEGACFTLGYYAKLGAALGDTRTLLDGAPASLAKDNAFCAQHILAPVRGLALFINAFNFPAWGLWEKAAPALLSGVPVVIKPATATAWLTHRMVADVLAAKVLPEGALSIVCGGSAGLLDALQPFDVLSFTGSADTAAQLRAHPAIARNSVRANIEADSLNAFILGPDGAPGSAVFDNYVADLARELTIKSGQRCTAPRRALVPAEHFDAVAEALGARLSKVVTGNPRNESVRMGALVSRAQWIGVHDGIADLVGEVEVLVDGRRAPLVDADADVAACIAPTVLGVRDGAAARRVHDHEIFGPVTTLIGYRADGTGDANANAFALAHRGLGSLVASAYSADTAWLARAGAELAGSHGRVHLVNPDVAKVHSGHGNVMPAAVHGGPGRAGGGEELGGWRALGFYHRRSALQAAPAVLAALDHAAPLP